MLIQISKTMKEIPKKKREIPKKKHKKNQQHALPEPTDIVGVNAHTAAGIRIVLRKGREGQHL